MTSSGPRTIKLLNDGPAVDAGSVNDDDSGDGTDEATRGKALGDMEQCQKELEELNEKAMKEILQVETKYNKIRTTCYDKRATIIEKIPMFWSNVIINHPHISMYIFEEEEECLHFLTKLEVEEFENGSFRLKFVFGDNPFFENRELVKEFQLGPNNTKSKSTSTTIKWKENMDLSKKQLKIIDQKRKCGLEEDTFFSWFSDNNSDPATDIVPDVIKDDIWPNPSRYYSVDEDREFSEESDDDEFEEGNFVEVEEEYTSD